MFTAFYLQEKLKEEIERIFKDDRFPDKNGELASLNVFKQFLPINDTEYTEESQEELEKGILDEEIMGKTPFPYILVILPDGIQNTKNKPGKTNVIVYIGIADKDNKRAGYEWLLNIIQKICERFQKNICLGNYRCGEEIQWELSGLDEHPFYFGALAMEFKTPAIEKEDNYC